MTLLYGVFFTLWVLKLYYKLYDKKTKKYVMWIGLLIVFWVLVRINKSVVSLDLQRIFWYLYYVPLIFIPVAFYMCSNMISGRLNKSRKIFIITVSIILFLMVISNDWHQFVFRFYNGIDNFDSYKHYYGYYLICIWIFYLLGNGMINLVIDRFKIKRDFKAFLPLLLLLGGLLYTVFYVMGIPVFRSSNLTIILSTLICLGIELMLYLNLIPNNSKYIKTFENSRLNMMIISLDGTTIYKTKAFSVLDNNILLDIKNGCVKDTYKDNDDIYNIKKNKDSYVIFKKDISKLNKYRKLISKKQKKLLLQQDGLKKEEKIKKELYKINLRKEVIIKLEDSLNDKRENIKKILDKKDINRDDLEKIKLLIAYCKRKSFLIISEFNDDIYNEVGIKLVIRELLDDGLVFGINGEVIVNKMKINSFIMATIYEVIFNVIENINNTNIMIFIKKDKATIKINIMVEGDQKIKDKLILDKNIVITEEDYDNDVNLSFTIKERR